jgi:hypothetical protein
MTVAMDKAKVSGIAGIVASIATFFSVYSIYFVIVGFGIFVTTLLIQYGSIKFKFVASFTTILGLIIAYFSEGGQLP